MKRQSKKGVSELVVTVLLVLITVAAVGVIYGAVMPIIKKGMETSQKCMDAELSIDTSSGYTCIKNNTLMLKVSRGEKEAELEGFQLQLGSQGNTKSVKIKPESEKIEEPLDPNLVGYWKFDNHEQKDTIALDSTNKNNGTIVGANWIANGKLGGAYNFDGNDDYVDVSRNFFGAYSSQTENVSVQMWIKPDAVNIHQALFDKHSYQSNYGDGFGIWFNSNNKIECETGNAGSGTGTSTSLSSLGINTWYHIVLVMNGLSGLIYINGKDDTNASACSMIYKNNLVNVWIGRAHSTFRYIQPTIPNNFNGTMDEVRIYNRSLSAAEIKELYQGKTGEEIVIYDEIPQQNAAKTYKIGLDEIGMENIETASVAPIIKTGETEKICSANTKVDIPKCA